MMVVKNDAATFKHTRMTFVDFLEAIGRLCDFRNTDPVPLEEKLPAYVSSFCATTLDMEWIDLVFSEVSLTHSASSTL